MLRLLLFNCRVKNAIATQSTTEASAVSSLGYFRWSSEHLSTVKLKFHKNSIQVSLENFLSHLKLIKWVNFTIWLVLGLCTGFFQVIKNTKFFSVFLVDKRNTEKRCVQFSFLFSLSPDDKEKLKQYRSKV